MNPAATDVVCVVDDNDQFRESAAWWLEGLGYEVRSFAGPNDCLAAVEGDGDAFSRACLLLDVRMSEMSGLQLLDNLKARGVERPVIFMTGHGDVPLAVQAMQKGALTFLEKPFQEQALEDALKQAFADQAPPTPEAEAYHARLAKLTPRERQIMDLVVAGDLNKTVAYKLDISVKTVELHRSRIMAKMEADSLIHLVRMAVTGEVQA